MRSDARHDYLRGVDSLWLLVRLPITCISGFYS